MWKRLLIAVGATVTIAALLALAGFFFKITFWGVFIVALLFQWFFFYIWNGYQENKIRLIQERLVNERIAEFAKQGTDTECQYCRQKQFIFLRFDVPNQFNCVKCNRPNSVFIAVEAAQLTTPVANTHTAAISEETLSRLADDALKASEPEEKKNDKVT